jgi:hypothetical protein
VPFEDTVFVVTASSALQASVTVDLSWSGTAVAGTDYANHPSSVVLPAGTTSVSVPAGITGTVGLKTIVLTVTNGAGYSVGTPATASATPDPSIRTAFFCPPSEIPHFTG